MDREADQGPTLLVQRKNAEARRLAARGKLRDALDVLNDAIYAAPGYPHLYATRAIVFDRLGMYPQAEADHLRAVDLAAAHGYSQEEVFADPEPPAWPARAPRRPPPLPRVAMPRVSIPPLPVPRVEMPRLTLPPPGSRAELNIILVAIAGLAALVVLLFFVAKALGNSDVDLNIFDFESFQELEPSPGASPTAGAVATVTPPPATPPADALSGNPYSYSSLEKAWQGKGMTVAVGAVSSDFSGFKVSPFDVNLSREGGTAALSLLVYQDRDAPKEDWDLPAGSRPSPKEGRVVPAHETIWWNSNIIAVVRSTTGTDISNDALDAVLNASP